MNQNQDLKNKTEKKLTPFHWVSNRKLVWLFFILVIFVIIVGWFSNEYLAYAMVASVVLLATVMVIKRHDTKVVKPVLDFSWNLWSALAVMALFLAISNPDLPSDTPTLTGMPGLLSRNLAVASVFFLFGFGTAVGRAIVAAVEAKEPAGTLWRSLVDGLSRIPTLK